MNFSSKVNDGTIAFDGGLAVEDSAEIRQALMEFVNSVDAGVIDLSKVSDIDVASLQLLCSAHKYALKKGRALRLGAMSEFVSAAVKASGFVHSRGCMREMDEKCFWLPQKVAAAAREGRQ